MAKLALQTKLENSREGRTFLEKTRKISCLVLFYCFEEVMNKAYIGVKKGKGCSGREKKRDGEAQRHETM